jgi:hypothetical protein
VVIAGDLFEGVGRYVVDALGEGHASIAASCGLDDCGVIGEGVGVGYYSLVPVVTNVTRPALKTMKLSSPHQPAMR